MNAYTLLSVSEGRCEQQLDLPVRKFPPGWNLAEEAEGVLEDLRDPMCDSIHIDKLIGFLIDDTSDLKAYVYRVMKGEEGGPYAEKIRDRATRYAYAVANRKEEDQ